MEVKAGERLWEEINMLPVDEREYFAIPKEVPENDIRGRIEERFVCDLDRALDFSGKMRQCLKQDQLEIRRGVEGTRTHLIDISF